MTNRIKKLFLVITVISVTSISAFAGVVIQPSGLPKAAQDFIKKSFPNDPILYAEQNRKDFEVALQSGIEIEFFMNGEWKEIKSPYQPLPATLLPNAVSNALKQKYPQASILKIEKQYSSYEISLDNRREIYISNNGEVLGEKLD
ncbi:hypothetical protein EPJ64_00435 [Brachyspira aalborgi]|uniref:Putative beta-lactamase-inhibitor-like PepSY-like domain-containing protein n=1 Tax=Brachyspira aalborgi TaxID=29522 RepID=A0AB38Q1U6_9SPIR|nr:PepSY-like domain-containing protein [Brachyspira aalborgi]MBS4762667.1 PepSY-like domain-containing protein [Brachyspira sp.]CCY76204.1 putative uncharacterized protein [Brachyspira sp. CAG:700]TXJ17304.1 hypothetical protein EPJ77_00165 [Brachyspira aalborgi]TXJ22897.1 hypothetical protein EPJ64_00435 [Brachyspira aalborgi]TXJ26770.1 hypothetical protein EPJ73_03695 [Brachyspira aalborgi]